MNGQKLIQSENSGQWATDRVEKAGTINPVYTTYICLRMPIRPKVMKVSSYTQIKPMCINKSGKALSNMIVNYSIKYLLLGVIPV